MRAFKKELTMLAVMIAIAVVTAVANPLFLGGDNLRNNVRHISLISLYALGQALVIIVGGIDLSIGSVICISAVATSYLAIYAGFGIGTAVSSRSASRWWWASCRACSSPASASPPSSSRWGRCCSCAASPRC